MTMPPDLPTLPEGWEWTTLEEVSEINPKFDGDDILEDIEVTFIPMRCVTELAGHIDLSLIRKLSEVRKGYTPFMDGDLLFAKITPCMENGKVAIAHGLKNGMGFGSTEFYVIRLYKQLSRKFFFFLLIRDELRKDAQRNMKGTAGQLRVPTNYMRQIPIPLPPLPVQYRIAAKIDELFTKMEAGVESLEKTKAQLKRYRQSILKHAFEGKLTEEWRERRKDELEPASVLLERIKEERKKNAKGKYKELSPLATADLPELPEGWVWTRVGDICDTTSGGTPSRENKRYYGGNIPWLKSGELKNNTISSTEEYITEAGLENSSAKIIPAGTLLMALYGATVGKLGIIGIDSAINQAICAIFAPSQLEKKYLFWYLMSCRNELLNSRIGGAQPNISQTIVNKIILPLSSLPEQQKIVEEIEHRFSLADDVERIVDQSLKQSERLRQSILKRAFEGKLVLQDPNDEPASLLIERIKKERILIQSKEKKKMRIKTKPRVKRQEKMNRDSEAEIKTKSLYEILKSTKKPLTPEELWELSKLDLDNFYTQLKKEVEKGMIMERRPNETEVFLEVAK